jgi:hypothetical protein
MYIIFDGPTWPFFTVRYTSKICITREEDFMDKTFMTTEELADKLRYDARYVREYLKDSVLLEGVHYFRPFGRRKILYIWEAIEKDMFKNMAEDLYIPLSRGGVCHG